MIIKLVPINLIQLQNYSILTKIRSQLEKEISKTLSNAIKVHIKMIINKKDCKFFLPYLTYLDFKVLKNK